MAFQNRAIDKLIIDHQNAFDRNRRAHRQCIFGNRQRQPKPKARPFAKFAVHPNSPPHPFDQPLSDGQTQTCAIEFTVRLAFDLVEFAKNVIQILGRDPDAGVFDRHMQLLAARFVFNPDHADHHMALFGEFHRIANKVGQNLPQPPRITDKPRRQKHVEIYDQIKALFQGAWLQQHGNFMNGSFKIKGFRVQSQPFSLNLGIIQNIVDDHQQCLTRRADGFCKQALFVGKGGVAQQFSHAHNAVHRGSDLVAHIRQKGRFCAICRFSLAACGFKCRLLFLLMSDINAEANAAAIGRYVVLRRNPPTIGQLLFNRHAGIAVLCHAC